MVIYKQLKSITLKVSCVSGVEVSVLMLIQYRFKRYNELIQMYASASITVSKWHHRYLYLYIFVQVPRMYKFGILSVG